MKRFRKLLLKNTFAIMVPAMLLCVVLIFLMLKFPVLKKIQDITISPEENLNETLEQLIKAETTNVRYTANNIKYTGVDYLVNRKVKGAYYYRIEDNQLQFFVVATKKPEEIIESIELRGKAICDDVVTEYIVNQYARETGLDFSMLYSISSPYIISEVDYPYSFTLLVYIMMVIPVILCILILCYTVIIWLAPAIHPQAKQLREYGSIYAVIDELDSQLKYKLIFKKNNIYITDDYMIVSYLSKTDVVKLDDIKYMSKNLIDEPRALHRKGDIYRLTMSNPEKFFYEVDFSSEELIDTVVANIMGVQKNLDTKL